MIKKKSRGGVLNRRNKQHKSIRCSKKRSTFRRQHKRGSKRQRIRHARKTSIPKDMTRRVSRRKLLKERLSRQGGMVIKKQIPSSLPSAGGICKVPEYPNIFIITDIDTHEVFVFDITRRTVLFKIGGTGTEDGKFRLPTGVVVTKDSTKVFVADTMNNRVQVLSLNVTKNNGEYSASLNYSAQFGGEGTLSYPRGLALTNQEPQTVLVAESTGHKVSEWHVQPLGAEGSQGDYEKIDREFGTGEFSSGEVGALQEPVDVTVLSKSNNIAIADKQNNCVSVFHYNGNFAYVLVSEGENDGCFKRPCGITADSDDNLFVVDKEGHTLRLHVFSSLGCHLQTLKLDMWDKWNKKGDNIVNANVYWYDDETGEGQLAIVNSLGHFAIATSNVCPGVAVKVKVEEVKAEVKEVKAEVEEVKIVMKEIKAQLDHGATVSSKTVEPPSAARPGS